MLLFFFICLFKWKTELRAKEQIIETEKHSLECSTYAAETWTLTEACKKLLQAFENAENQLDGEGDKQRGDGTCQGN